MNRTPTEITLYMHGSFCCIKATEIWQRMNPLVFQLVFRDQRAGCHWAWFLINSALSLVVLSNIYNPDSPTVQLIEAIGGGFRIASEQCTNYGVLMCVMTESIVTEIC